MTRKIIASEYETPYEAYRAAKFHQARVEEIVHIACQPAEKAEIAAVEDEDLDGAVDAGDVCEMWGTSHAQSGSWEWRIHLVSA